MDDSSSSISSSSVEQSSRKDLEPLPLTEGAALRRRGNSVISEAKNSADLQLSRTISRRITNSDVLTNNAMVSEKPLPPMGGGRSYPLPYLLAVEDFMVVFDGENDPLYPQNWALKTRLINGGCALFAPFTIQVGSAIIAPSTEAISNAFHVGRTVATLSTSLFIFGFAAGPVLWGPLSELYGRRPILVLSSFGYLCFAFGAATAKDLQTLMLCRFFSGFIGGAPAVVTPSTLSDMFPKSRRGLAMCFFGLVIFSGPMVAPVIGGFTMRNPDLGFRWNLYFAGFFGCVSFLLILVVFKETHHPSLLTQRAEELRRRTGNRAIFSAHEEISLSVGEIFKYNIARPVRMLFTEPILALVSLYNAFMYGILYLLLTAVPLVFGGVHLFSQGLDDLPYLAILIGIVLGTLIIVFFDRSYSQKLTKIGSAAPEDRLPAMLVGSIIFPLGMFWFGWTGSYPSIHWIVPLLGLIFVGAGLITVFLPCITYIVDTYLHIAASALALNAFLRAGFGGAFPLFAHQMFLALLIKWGCTLIGGFSILLVPVPFVFYRYGEAIRSKSKLIT